MRRQVVERTTADLALVRGLAEEAAYQLSSDLAGEVAAGLALDNGVLAVTLSDNYGGVLGQFQRPAAPTSLPWLAGRLFGGISDYKLALQSRALDGTTSEVGQLELKLDGGTLMNRYLAQVTGAAFTGALRTALLCALVVAVFYVLITKPLLRITGAIARVDPAQPGGSIIEPPGRHRHDELGMLVATVNTLLAESQRGLDGRDSAEGELAALARNLEMRVQQRTQELAREKEELNRANGDLEQANRFISDGIRYASRIQTALLPDEAALSGMVADMAVGWWPRDIVGGDYYWAGGFGRKGLVAVMDCTGHGVPGAFMTAVVAAVFARIVHHHGHEDPAAMLATLSRLVKSALRQDRPDAPADDGLDAGICVFDLDAQEVVFAGANLSLLVGEGPDGPLAPRFSRVKGNRASLGYRDTPDDAAFTTHRIPIRPGTTFYLATDGLTDQVGGEAGRMFGRRRLQETLAVTAGKPLPEQRDALFARLEEWRGSERRRDDMTLVAFRPR
ncbi:MAG: SpoIIE family protein phosphatase [Magnetospirillum sp.]|nr:SpoIIE family protein phosphatase [Magnetospirillum sp.]